MPTSLTAVLLVASVLLRWWCRGEGVQIAVDQGEVHEIHIALPVREHLQYSDKTSVQCNHSQTQEEALQS